MHPLVPSTFTTARRSPRFFRALGWALALPAGLGILGILGGLPAAARDTRFFMDPKIEGSPIWPCIDGGDFEQACSGRAVAQSATEFCVAQGYMAAAEYYIESVEFPWQRFAVVGWTEGRDQSGKVQVGWTDKGDRYDRFSMVECRNF